MRRVALAAFACLSVMGVSDAGADVSTRRPTHIPAQKLGSALRALAHDRQFYVLFAAQDIAGLQTQGVTGDLTSQEALDQLLNGTGLTYRFVDDKTVNILPIKSEARLMNEAAAAPATPTAWVGDAAAAAQPQSVGDTTHRPSESEIVTVTVIGSRGLPRTDVERPVPVDIVSGRELLTTGQTDLGQQVQFNSPSFNSAKYGVNGTTNYADPASLRGLAPDQVLVLVNGKRRHQFSALNLNVAPGAGTVVTDLNSIPSGAIKRIEVLRDGAAAQYGSDAIAGIVNLVLNDGTDGVITATGGTHKEGDGDTYKASLNQGMSLGVGGRIRELHPRSVRLRWHESLRSVRWAHLSGDAGQLCDHGTDTGVSLCDGQSAPGSWGLSARCVRHRQLRQQRESHLSRLRQCRAAGVRCGECLWLRRLFA